MTDEPKKGKKSWKPSALLHVINKKPGRQYRWVDTKDAANYARRIQDGWEPESAVSDKSVAHERPGHIGDGKPISSVTEYRGMVLCSIPEEDYQEHREFYRNMTLRQTAGLQEKLEAENRARAQRGTAARLYGKTIIE